MILIAIIYICIFSNYMITTPNSSYYFGCRTTETKYRHLPWYIALRNHKQNICIIQTICPYHQQSKWYDQSQKYFHECNIHHSQGLHFKLQHCCLLAQGKLKQLFMIDDASNTVWPKLKWRTVKMKLQIFYYHRNVNGTTKLTIQSYILLHPTKILIH